MNSWLKDAVFYQIYPTSFYDSNGDGIGDLKGIEQKLPYLKSLGVNAIWLNPFYKSPFMDGGYDVADYYKIDKKFGKMADFTELVKACKKEKIRLIVDLVVGHTSTEHKWFLESAKDEKNKYSDYYIWTNNNFNKYKDKTIHGLFPRDGGYYINYYACQPALNYGFNKVEKDENVVDYCLGNSWQMSYQDERLQPLREEILNIMRFWLKKGVDGFRVDLANSLVKGCVYSSDKDEDVAGNKWLWNLLFSTIKKEYPDCAFIAEWVYAKNAVGKCGFDVDFYAHDIRGYNDLFRNEKGDNLLPTFEQGDNYFSKDGKGNVGEFLRYYLSDLTAIENKGYVSVPTGSHDQVRLAFHKDEETLKVVYAFLLTIKQVPFLYYGDEIAMTHNAKLNKDGGYIRTGARTPMQWTNGKNRGFSTAEELYLPVNGDRERSVESMEKDKNSLLNTVRKLIKIRKENSCLNADGKIEVLEEKDGGYPLVYRREDDKEEILVAINPGKEKKEISYSVKEVLFTQNAEVQDGKILLNEKSFVIFKR